MIHAGTASSIAGLLIGYHTFCNLYIRRYPKNNSIKHWKIDCFDKQGSTARSGGPSCRERKPSAIPNCRRRKETAPVFSLGERPYYFRGDEHGEPAWKKIDGTEESGGYGQDVCFGRNREAGSVRQLYGPSEGRTRKARSGCGRSLMRAVFQNILPNARRVRLPLYSQEAGAFCVNIDGRRPVTAVAQSRRECYTLLGKKGERRTAARQKFSTLNFFEEKRIQ